MTIPDFDAENAASKPSQGANQMMIKFEERRQTPSTPTSPSRKEGDGDGPEKPEVTKPDTRDLIKRMQRVDPDTARRYRQPAEPTPARDGSATARQRARERP